MRIQIICRGSVKHGLGHLFRTRTFTKAAQEKHSIEILAIIEKDLENVFFELKDKVRFLRSENEILPLVNSFNPQVLIFDLTYIEEDLIRQLKFKAKLTTSISPVFNQMSKIDILFTRSKYYKHVKGVKIYGGLEYAIFNEYATRIDSHVYQRNLEKPHLPIAVSMGGTDSPNKTLKVIKVFADFQKELSLWVTLGEGYIH